MRYKIHIKNTSEINKTHKTLKVKQPYNNADETRVK